MTSDSLLAFASAGMAFLSVYLIFGVGRSASSTASACSSAGAVYVLYLGLVAIQLSGVLG